ncbi:hypothetical protein NDU88_005122 [Pleurodeles waltl]|uniref:Uncharacterized protein n=1 Tax=Pleurodeles waltl TaxID=8319 RepID=A0AAV7VMM3_PLEWA|nr:hypothetical protein NDU88_005122 [Pleurodeles waltl]
MRVAPEHRGGPQKTRCSLVWHCTPLKPVERCTRAAEEGSEFDAQEEATARATGSLRAATEWQKVSCRSVSAATQRPERAAVAGCDRGPDQPRDIAGHCPIGNTRGAKRVVSAGRQLRTRPTPAQKELDTQDALEAAASLQRVALAEEVSRDESDCRSHSIDSDRVIRMRHRR